MTRGQCWRELSQQIDRLDARLLIEHQTGCTHAQLIAHPEAPVSHDNRARLAALAGRRAAGEPLAYLIGWAEFRGLRLAVSPAVLVPRPETELLVELALARMVEVASPRIADLGTGSGAIALALKTARPDAQVVAVDRSTDALTVARANGARLGEVSWRESDWFSALDGCFDLIVSNPPYVAAGDVHLDGDGVRFEPAMALTDGADGLTCVRRIVAGAAGHLKDGGWLLFEHGFDQATACRELLAGAGFDAVGSWRDLCAIERVSGGRWPGV
jgi:release factor glutamine methyltransferase